MEAEQINKRVEEAVAAIKKVRETNEDLREGLKKNGNTIHLNIDLEGEILSIGVPVKIDDEPTGEPISKDDGPIGTFNP